jgi:hypothetical protein
MSKTYYDSTDRDSKAIHQWATKKANAAARKESRKKK